MATMPGSTYDSNVHEALKGIDGRAQLLIAQAVTTAAKSPPDWNYVADLLRPHLSTLNLNARQCELAWQTLMRQRGIVNSASSATARTDLRAHGALAELLAVERMEWLKREILQREGRAKCVQIVHFLPTLHVSCRC